MEVEKETCRAASHGFPPRERNGEEEGQGHGNGGRPVRDLFVGTSDPDTVLVIEKPTTAKIAEIQQAAATGSLMIRANPAVGVSKNQLGTQFGGCYLRGPSRRSVGRRYVPSISRP
jgi:hypothetical protein